MDSLPIRKRPFTDSPSPPNTETLPTPDTVVATTGTPLSLEEKERMAKRARHGFERTVQGTSSRAPSVFDTRFVNIQMNSPEKLEKLYEVIIDDGIGHVAWGNRPAGLIWKEQFELFDELRDGGLALKDNFILLKASDNEEESLGYGGMLVNKGNVERLLQDNPAAFKNCSFLAGKEGFEEVMQHLVEHQCTEDLLCDHLFLGTILGYGRANSEKYSIGDAFIGIGTPEQKELLKKELDNSVSNTILNEILDLLPDDHTALNHVSHLLRSGPEEMRLQNVKDYLTSGPEAGTGDVYRFPGFVAWDSPETTKICIQAIQDAINIHTQHLPPHVSDDKNEIFRHFFQTILHEPVNQ